MENGHIWPGPLKGRMILMKILVISNMDIYELVSDISFN